MELDIDVGNSRLKWRLRSGQSVVVRGDASHEAPNYFPATLPWQQIAQVNVGCVAKPTVIERIRVEVQQAGVPQLFVATTAARFEQLINAYQDPSKLGVDRWLAMIAAYRQVQSAFCVVDCGTAVTVDFVAADGRHAGGYIVPGFELQRQALHLGTHAVKVPHGRLPELTPGTSTADCVLHGVYALLRHGLEGMLRERFRQQAFQIFYTGGDASRLRDEIELPSRLEPDLVLDGLRILAEAER